MRYPISKESTAIPRLQRHHLSEPALEREVLCHGDVEVEDKYDEYGGDNGESQAEKVALEYEVRKDEEKDGEDIRDSGIE